MSTDNIREEYIALRAEILQLNSQAFALVSGSLTINFTILGFGLSKTKLIEIDPLIPFFGALVLVTANILIAHKVRVAHRLALYQKYFIEPNMPGIRWAKVGYMFREYFKKKQGILSEMTERFHLIQTTVLFVPQMINAAVIFLCHPPSKYNGIVFSITLLLMFIQMVLLKHIGKYKLMEEVFRELAKQSSEQQKENVA